MNDNNTTDAVLIDLTSDIVSAYISKNNVPPAELPALIATTHAALMKLGIPVEPEPIKLEPPVSIRKSVTPDYIISLEDGRQYQALKRHLTRLGMTPDEYRQKWKLPRDYPMVAPNYAARRSELARSSGLGKIQRDRAAARAAQADPTEKSPGRRGRPKMAEATSAD